MVVPAVRTIYRIIRTMQVIGMWADGSACKGSTADSSFQSHGGNCFKDIEFVPDCHVAHGPGARAGDVHSTDKTQPLCECDVGYEAAAIGDGSWQCNVAVPGGTSPSSELLPAWAWWLCAACLLVSVVSIGVAVRATRKLAQAAGQGGGLQQTLVPSATQVAAW